MKNKKIIIAQVKNPKTGLYVKIDRKGGQILAHKATDGPYKGIPIVRRQIA